MGIRFTRAAACAALAILSLATVAAAQRVDDDLLYLRAGTVDPAASESLLSQKAFTFEPSADYLIKLDGPMTPQRRAVLEDAGVRLGDYIPRHAWRVDLAKADIAAIRRLDFVTWLGEFDPAWKLAPTIAAARPFESSARRDLQSAGTKRVIVHLAPKASKGAFQRAVASCGGLVCKRSLKEGAHRLMVDIAADRVRDLSNNAAVRFVEEAPESAPRNHSNEWIAQSNIPNVTSIWDHGLHGEDQLVGVIDWDVDEMHCAFFDDVPIGDMHRKFQAYYGFDQNLLYGWHGTHVVDTLAGDPLDPEADENLRGMAYAARIVFQDQAATITPTNLFDRLTIAHNDGARIHSNSWGATSDNSYNAWAHDIDAFSFQNEDDLVVFAVINGGATTPILSPENAKNCLAVGASGDAPNQGDPGSGGTGPTIDGRQKPEVWLPACNSTSANIGTGCGLTTRSCATSWAAPAASGMATLTRQYFVDGYYPTGTPVPADALIPSGSLLKAMLINSAVDMTGIDGYFEPREGWGRVLMDDPLYFDGDARHLLVEDIRRADGLATGESDDYMFDVRSANEPLKVTMVFADAPSTIGTSFAPVNDLDLVLTSPSGVTYLGNVFELNESTTGGAADVLNNSEQVHRLLPEVGRWQVTVSAAEVNEGPQGYALVMTGDVAPTGTPQADLEVTFAPAGPIGAAPGDIVQAKIAIYNRGPATAANVRINYEMPVGLTLGLMRLTGLDCTPETRRITCNIAELAPNAPYSVPLRIRVDQSGSFTTTASVSSNTFDPTPENNTAPFVIETSVNADLSVSIVDAPATLLPGTSANVSVEVRNNGPDSDPSPSLSVAPDSGLVVDSVSTCVAMPNDATCSLAALSGGDAVIVTATVRATTDSNGTRNIEFSVTGASDSNTDNDSTVISIDILADADGDGIADPNDICANGDDSQDTDSDGVPDACDECPSDPNKTLAGVCDCGMPDTDTDEDGIPDCADLCPNDPAKIIPGDCGCGASDEDTNGNGVPDCLDTPIDNSDTGGEMPTDTPDDTADNPFRFEDLDPCFVRYVLQSFLGIPLCGPCISFSLIGMIAGMSLMRRRNRRGVTTRRRR